MTSVTLPGETAGDSTTSWSYTTWCQPTGAQTPCLELDQTQRVDSSHTLTTRAFYDGAGRLVETRTPGPGGQDVLVYAQYDAAGRPTKRSVPCRTSSPPTAARRAQSDAYTYDGNSAGPHVTTTDAYTMNGAGLVLSVKQTTTVNGGTNGSPTAIVSVDAHAAVCSCF